MKHTTLLSATLGLPASWHVIEARLSEEKQRLDLTVTTAAGSSFKCPRCGCNVHPSDESRETWYHDNFLNLRAYLTAHVPRITCPQGCGLQRVPPPWERPGSRFRQIPENAVPEE